MSRESDLLDALEDAQDDHDSARRMLKFGLGLGFSGIGLIIATVTALTLLQLQGIDLGDSAGAINILYGVMTIAGSVITGGTWFNDLPNARKRLKRAQREHRNYLMSK